MTLMNPLEQEILKLEKKGYKTSQKRKLKYGLRIFLNKKGGFLSSDEGVYFYHVDGDVTTDNLRECFKDYAKFYEDKSFDNCDKGFFVASGRVDEKLFKDLRKAMISDDDIRKSIKLLALNKHTEKEIEKEVEKEQPKKEYHSEKEQEESHECNEIISKIKRFALHKKPKGEPELDSMLVHFLSAFYPDIETQVAYQYSRVDVKIGNIGIEIKFQPSSSEFDRLYGQVEKYLKYLDKVIVVVGFERTRELTDSFEKRVKERGWLNSKVYVISLK